jgi:peptidoglycan-N-acetylglucosamine deacetylase
VIYRVIALFTSATLLLAWALRLATQRLLGEPDLRLWPWIVVCLVVDGVLLYAMLERHIPLYGRILWRGRTTAPVVALTFDDGPTEPYTSQLLDILKQAGIPATFFVLGQRVAQQPETIRRAAAEGHQIENHGWDHAALPFRSGRFARAQIRRTSDAIEHVTGVRPTWFRAPRGWRNPWTCGAARREGCQCVAWTLGVYDTAHPGAAVIAQRAVDGLSNGCILLLHDGRDVVPAPDCSEVVAALPEILRGAARRGYRFATLSELAREAGRR